MEKTEKLLEKRTEKLIFRSMGSFGYLKVPFAFSDKFQYEREKVRDPDAVFSETKNEVRLTFVWKKDRNGKLSNKDESAEKDDGNENVKSLEKEAKNFLLRSMGAFGYLKVPFAFSKKFPYDRATVRDPDAFLSETEEEARLTFVWKKNREGKIANEDEEL